MDREYLVLRSYASYVDDSPNMLRLIKEDKRWENRRFEYKEEWAKQDKLLEDSDQVEISREMTRAMNDMIWFLRMTSEDHTMFKDRTLRHLTQLFGLHRRGCSSIDSLTKPWYQTGY